MKIKSIYECSPKELREREREIFRCDKCNKIFFHLDSVSESRGECFGFAAYEEVAVSPCCKRDFYELDDKEKSELSDSELLKATESESVYAERREMEAMYEYYMGR